MKPDPEVFRKILLNARQALQSGERHAARRWAERAVELVPDSEEAWLILAAVASPRASINYLEQALKINPDSQRAQRGMQWALSRLQAQQPAPPESVVPEPVAQLEPQHELQQAVAQPEPQVDLQPAVDQTPPSLEPRSPGPLARLRLPVLILLLITICAAAAWAFLPVSASPVLSFLHAPSGLAGILADVNKPVDTPTLTATQPPAATATPLPTLTDTPLPTDTIAPADTLAPTDTLVPTDTPVPPPTDTAIPTPTNTVAPAVSSAGGGVRWIDVSLSKQTLYAYEGNTVVRSFLVSTGVKQFPTVTGKYHIYVKYLYTLMHGDGYYLPNVPYTMYFYQSYGIHGTYWHHNFGHPMSHGCVNMYTPDAEWLYYWASVGTLVNIHY